MSATLVVVFVLSLAAAPPAPAPAQAPAGRDARSWYERYDRGVELIARGEARKAGEELRQALALRPDEDLHVRTYGLRFVDYLPHLHLAIASQMVGDLATARRELGLAETSGVAARSEAGAPLLAAIRIQLDEPSPPAASAAAPPPLAAHAGHPRARQTLSPAQFERLRVEVADRCRVGRKVEPADEPWYYHYELGLELADRGDDQRAIDELADATARRPQSQRWARTYGMWFVEYLPYLQLARLHARNGDWECATNALALSGEMGEVAPQDKEFAEVQRLTGECAEHASR